MTNLMSPEGGLFASIREDLDILEERLLASLDAPDESVKKIGEHLASSGGKRLRPALCLLAARCSSDFSLERVLPLATALELIHMASLVHDDVIDEAKLRRGVDTANAKWGNQIAILAGDFIFARAFHLVAGTGYDSYVQKRLSELVSGLAVGEIVQDREAYKAKEDLEDYYKRIKMKTADFLAIACELGALVSGVPREKAEKLAAYGYAIGMAFQITDDILDVTAKEERIGKAVGSDIRQGIVTLPALFALSHSEEREPLRAILTNPAMTDEDVTKALRIIRAAKGDIFAREKADKYIATAKEALPEDLPKEAREIFLKAADFIGGRSF